MRLARAAAGARSQRWTLALAVATTAAVALPAAALAQDFVVTKTTDTADAVCDADCSLREAIVAANAAAGADRVLLGATAYSLTLAGADDAGAVGDLDVTVEQLVLVGLGSGVTVVDGGDVDRVLDVIAGATLAVHGVTIRNGAAVADGGGIRSAGSLEVVSSTITDNVTAGDGGGIAVTSGTLELTDSVVSGNRGNSGAGGIRTLTATRTTLTRVDVTGNSAGALDAGGVENDATMTISDTAVVGNTAGSSAGGIRNNGGTLTIERSTISGNKALGTDSGGLFLAGGTTSLRQVTISGNQAATNGGGLRVQGAATLSLDGVTIAGNTSGSGGALAAFAPASALVRATIVGDNVGDQCQGIVIVSLGGNVGEGATCAAFTAAGDKLGPDPGLGPLAANGGRTQTHALLGASAALDAAGPLCGAHDQRAVRRPLGAACDSGAFEAQPDLRVTVVASPATVVAGDSVAYTVTVANAGVAAAVEVVLALAVSAGATPTAISASQGSCASPAACTLGTIGPGAQASVLLSVRSAAPGALLVTVSATTLADAAPNDNVVSQAATVTAATVPGAAARPSLLALPKLVGTARVGNALRCRGARFSDSTSRRFRWLRDSKRIRGQSAARYLLVAADLGKVVACGVRAIGPGGTVDVVSLGVVVRAKRTGP